jgi:hypothetical protein
VSKQSSCGGLRCFGDLAQLYVEGVDYAVHVMHREIGRAHV